MKKIYSEKELNEQQLEAVTTMGEPLLVVAGAGSGKTRVITYRIAYLIEQGVLPWHILAVTFTNKAANEMKTRVQKLIGKDIRMNIGTFHSICVRILRTEIERIGLNSNFIIYDGHDQYALIKRICRDLNLSDKSYHPRDIRAKISTAKNKFQTAKMYEEQAVSFYEEKVAKVYNVYESKLKLSNAVDFDDILLYTVQILKKYPEAQQKYQRRFQHILVDEYQDTNFVQYYLIKLLSGVGKKLCVVGDPDQSIYRWRGADIRNILNFEQDYQGVKRIKLEQNYRSTKNILAASNSVISNNRQRQHKELWSQKESGDPIAVYHLDDERTEASFVINMIEELRRTRSISYSDIVIFYRTHAQSRVFEESLRFAGVPYDIVGGLSFYERKEVKDIIAYLKLIVCPQDEVSLHRIINMPTRGIGKGALTAIAETARNHNKTFNQVIWEAVSKDELPVRILSKIKKFALLMEKFRSQAEKISVADLIREIIIETNYFSELKKEEKTIAEIRIENIKELVSAAEDFLKAEGESNLLEFLEAVTLVSDIDQWEESAGRLTLMTLHAAKGLEFEVVIMVGVEQGLCPHASSLEDPEELEEERRLCYVGMTRAKSKLVMTHVTQRMLFGQRSYRICSPFIAEIPRELKCGDFDVVADDGNTYQEFETQECSCRYEIGQTVVHSRYGMGQVLEVEDYGDDMKVQVMFRSRVSWFLGSSAELTVVAEGEGEPAVEYL